MKITPEELIIQLEENVPDVYLRVCADVPLKRGGVKNKRCLLNLTTGDVFDKRKVDPSSMSNYRIPRQWMNVRENKEAIVWCGYQHAQITEAGITIVTWCFADDFHNPGTAHIDGDYTSSAIDVTDLPRSNKVDPEAIFNVAVSQPHIAAMAVVTPSREVMVYEDIENYGCLSYRGKPDIYLGEALMNTIHKAYDTRRIPHLVECFKKQFGIGYLGANKYVAFNSYKDVSPFMRAKPLVITNNANQALVDELNAIPLPDYTHCQFTEDMICFANRVNDEWVVLRWWMKSEEFHYVEVSRMYVNKTQAVQCRSDLLGHWAFSSAKLKAATFKSDRVVLESEDVFDGTKLEYFKNIAADSEHRSAALYMLTMYPEFEKMYKAGMDWLCNDYMTNPSQSSWKNFIEMNCGEVDWKAKNLNKMLGLNSYQMQAISRWRNTIDVTHLPYWKAYYARSIIRTMKNIFVSSSINNIDNKTFDYILSTMNEERLSGTYSGMLARTYDMYGKDAIHFIKDLNAISDGTQHYFSDTDTTVRRSYRYSMTIDGLYGDVIQMIQHEAYQDRIRPRFSSLDELLNIHRILTDLVNAEQAERDARRYANQEIGFSKYRPVWEKYEWEGNGRFCVIAPNKPIDIAHEGITLHHCVKTYISSVANGETNILFIRDVNKKDEPFFTVEVYKNSIRQVHGMHNCNVDSVAGLTEFVMQWAKTKKLKYSSSYANGLRVAPN